MSGALRSRTRCNAENIQVNSVEELRVDGRLSGQNPGAAIPIERCSARKTGLWETSRLKFPETTTFLELCYLKPDRPD